MFLFFQCHEDCVPLGSSACDCGSLRDHILPPWAIYSASKVQISCRKYSLRLCLIGVGVFQSCACVSQEVGGPSCPDDTNLRDITPDGHLLQVCCFLSTPGAPSNTQLHIPSHYNSHNHLTQCVRCVSNTPNQCMFDLAFMVFSSHICLI